MTTTHDILQILELLPHRYPMLLVDRVVEQVNGKYIKAYKNVTVNEPFFTGHFPQKPIMPGVQFAHQCNWQDDCSCLALCDLRTQLGATQKGYARAVG